jgi:hypothetical protein
MMFEFIEPSGVHAGSTMTERFEYMAEEIRRVLRLRTRREANQRDPYVFDFMPRYGTTLQRAVQFIESITGEWLEAVYEAILQSQEVIELLGFKVIFIFLF